MAVRQHETVGLAPSSILRIEPHHAIPDGVDQRRQRHWRAGMPGLGLLYRIHRERADGVDGQLIQIRAGGGLGYWGHLVTSSSAATLRRRRRWRSAWLNS